MNAFENVIEALRTNGRKIRLNGNKLIAQCPAHNDNNPSLSIAYSDGKVLLTCFAGCQVNDIVAALQLNINDLFDETLQPVTNVVDMARYRLDLAPTPTEQQPVSETLEWIYTDADHTPLIKTIKTRLPDGKKTFRQYHWNGNEWVSGLGNTTPVLYNLPQVSMNAAYGGITVICEGEKDADTYNAHNSDPDIWATTAPMGAGKWKSTYTDTLQGCREVWIIPDNDKPGLDHANKIIDALDQANITWRLLTVNPNVKDLTDHINAGWTLADLTDNNELAEQAKTDATKKALERAIDEERIKQQARDYVRKEIAENNAAGRYTLPIYAKTLTDELAKPDHETIYIINDLWPTGANISLTATYKAGKTSTINNIVKSLVDGNPLFEHFNINHTGRIALCNYEVSDNQMRRWVRETNIINTDNVTLLNMRGHTWPLTSDYVIEQTIDMLGSNNIKTWIIDPLARAFVGSGDENSNQDVGIFLDTLDYIKDQAGVDNLLIAAHTGRNAEQGNSRARGASRFDDWVDARWMLTKDADGQRWFEADGRDVTIPQSRLDWDEITRKQIIAYGVGKAATKLERDQQRVYDIIVSAEPNGINRQKIIDTYKAAYKQESLSGESADTGTLGQLQNSGLIYKIKVGNSWLFRVTNNQLQVD